MVKIGVIFMSFSNPTDHFRDTADFTVCTVFQSQKQLALPDAQILTAKSNHQIHGLRTHSEAFFIEI